MPGSPVPVSATDCVLLLVGASSVMTRLAERAPPWTGAKATLIWQLSLGSRPPLGWQPTAAKRNSPGLVPARAILLMFSGAVPLFLTLTVAGALSAPTCVVPKSMVVGLM